jgi:DNA-binding transcriptional ArsR family regulator
MVNNDAYLNKTFAALSDPTRRAILARLGQGSATVTEVAKPFDMSLPAISKHLRVLEEAGLLTRERTGRIHHLYINPQPMKQASQWLAFYEQFWTESLDALERFLEEPEEVEPSA